MWFYTTSIYGLPARWPCPISIQYNYISFPQIYNGNDRTTCENISTGSQTLASKSHRGLVNTEKAGSHQKYLSQWVWGRALQLVFLTRSQGMLMWLGTTLCNPLSEGFVKIKWENRYNMLSLAQSKCSKLLAVFVVIRRVILFHSQTLNWTAMSKTVLSIQKSREKQSYPRSICCKQIARTTLNQRWPIIKHVTGMLKNHKLRNILSQWCKRNTKHQLHLWLSARPCVVPSALLPTLDLLF